jgi:hypothetical protein
MGKRLVSPLWLPFMLALVISSDQAFIHDLVIPATGLSDALRAVPYSAALTAIGGRPPYLWRILDGKLPTGLELNAASGQILGTPNEGGVFSVTIEASEGEKPKSRRGTRPISLTVEEKESIRSGMGPLRVSNVNPRYFQDADGNVIYLTGSHTWTDFQDIIPDPAGKSIADLGGFSGYLDFLQQHNHNFTRLWLVEHAWDSNDGSRYSPMPYPRTGPGMALDGQPKFRLDRFNQAYFDRLRQRVAEAQSRGIYVGVMLFDDWSTESPGAWKGHPFNKDNNINGIDGDANGDGLGIEYHTMAVPGIVTLEEAYVRKVIDTINDLDNVIYEIANETDASAAWQAYFIDFVRNYEAGKPKQHPVGTTAGDDAKTDVTNQWLMESASDWVAPRNENQDYLAVDGGPPAANGRKVILSDTDHLPHSSQDLSNWVWKSFMRGLNPIFMDSLDLGSPDREAARRALGQTLTYANRIDLAHMSPRGDLVSSGYCLANPGREYLIYLPQGPNVIVNLTSSSQMFSLEWFKPMTGERASAAAIKGGGSVSLRAPFPGKVVLYLFAHQDLR